MKLLLLIMVIGAVYFNSAAAYEEISADSLRNRMLKNYDFILLDVREVEEFVSGHIAEPAGQVPLSPCNLPWSSNCLQDEYERLPIDKEIIVYCAGGFKSAQAAAFLEKKAYKVINLLGAYKNWQYETRDGAYGAGNGKWLYLNDNQPDELNYEYNGKTSRLFFPSGSIDGYDSVYVEIQNVSGMAPVPQGAPVSSQKGLFQMTLTDQFGISLFEGDSLVFFGNFTLELSPDYDSDTCPNENVNIYEYIPGIEWQKIDSPIFNEGKFTVTGHTLRKWYCTEGFVKNAIIESGEKDISFSAYPNPFENEIIFSFRLPNPDNITIKIFDIHGDASAVIPLGLVERGEHACRWNAAEYLDNGNIYFYTVANDHEFLTFGKLIRK